MGVLEDISAFSNPFGAPSKGEWNLSKGIFTNSLGQQIILFFEERKGEDRQQMTAMDNVDDTGGRRLAIYEYPYIDGQQVKDMGRKGETHNFSLKFFGPNYQFLLQEFFRVCVNDSGSGILLHPTLSSSRGAMSVKLRDYAIVHRHDEWNAVNLKVVFIEDSTGQIRTRNLAPVSTDSILRSALQTLSSVQSFVEGVLFDVGALLLLPGSIIASFEQRLESITGAYSRLIGQISATFSPTSNTLKISSEAGSLNTSPTNLNSGTTTSGNTLPPVFQAGFDPTTQAYIDSQRENFINSNQITPQQAIFQANQVRQSITTAIAEIETIYGNDGYSMILEYRRMANSIQEMVEVAISSSRSKLKVYTTPKDMSLRAIAKENGLSPDRQNDIEALNPYLPSVNFVLSGSKILVPIS